MFPRITEALNWIEEYVINGAVAWIFNLLKDIGLFFTESEFLTVIMGLLG